MDVDKYSNDHILKYSGLKDLTAEMKEGFDEHNLEMLIEQLKQRPEFNIRKANKQFLTNEESVEYLKMQLK